MQVRGQKGHRLMAVAFLLGIERVGKLCYN